MFRSCYAYPDPRNNPQVGCFVASGNGTTMHPSPNAASKIPCLQDVPFRDIAHAITARALNQSSMYLQIPCPRTPDTPWPPDWSHSDLELMVPNEWFRLMGTAMGVQINALPRSAWEAFRLNATQPLGTDTSFAAVFDRLIASTMTRYLEETSASWPWTPPPPPPPPTPPPCPGGSLQVSVLPPTRPSRHALFVLYCVLCHAALTIDAYVTTCCGAGVHRLVPEIASGCLQRMRKIVCCRMSRRCG